MCFGPKMPKYGNAAPDPPNWHFVNFLHWLEAPWQYASNEPSTTIRARYGQMSFSGHCDFRTELVNATSNESLPYISLVVHALCGGWGGEAVTSYTTIFFWISKSLAALISWSAEESNGQILKFLRYFLGKILSIRPNSTISPYGNGGYVMSQMRDMRRNIPKPLPLLNSSSTN